MSKENEFKILYWNIHFMDGSASSDEKLKNSSEIIVDIIKEYNDEIKAIVFTEAYPQFEYDKYNTIILDYLKGLDYNVYPYDLNNYSDPNHYPFKKNAEFKNGILIATKSKAQLVGMPQNEPNLLGIKIQELGLNLIGVRLFSKNKEQSNEEYELQYTNHMEIITRYLDEEKANVVIGDFNMDDDSLEQYIDKTNAKLQICKGNEFGTNVALCKDIKGNKEIAKFCINSPDKLLLLNCNGKFNMEKTPEQIYCKKEYIDNDMFNKDGSRNSRYGRLNDKICKLGIKENPKKRTAHAGINYDIDFIKKEYNKFGIRFPYISSSVCIVPFPDHNLMLGSVDLGD